MVQTCQWCNRQYKNKQALRGHLRCCAPYQAWKRENNLDGIKCYGVLNTKYHTRNRGKHLGKRKVLSPTGELIEVDMYQPDRMTFQVNT